MLPNEPWLEQYVPTGRLALDIGANVGVFSAHLVDRFTEVHAFEPHSEAAAAYRERFNGRARLETKAVGAECGTLTLQRFQESVHTSAVVYDDLHLNMFVRGDAADTFEVPMVSVDSLGLAPDFVKVDTEGFEYQVLLGAQETLRTVKPTVLIEIHSLKFGMQCARLLGRFGYEFEIVPHPSFDAGPNNYWIAGLPGGGQ